MTANIQFYLTVLVHTHNNNGIHKVVRYFAVWNFFTCFIDFSRHGVRHTFSFVEDNLQCHVIKNVLSNHFLVNMITSKIVHVLVMQIHN